MILLKKVVTINLHLVLVKLYDDNRLFIYSLLLIITYILIKRYVFLKLVEIPFLPHTLYNFKLLYK